MGNKQKRKSKNFTASFGYLDSYGVGRRVPHPSVLPSVPGLSPGPLLGAEHLRTAEGADQVTRERLEAESRGSGTGLWRDVQPAARTARVLAGSGNVRRRGVRWTEAMKVASERCADRSPALGVMRPGEERPVEGGACGSVSELELLKLCAAERIDQAADRLGALSHSIWSEPELAYGEHHAHSVLTRFFQCEPPAASWMVQPHYHLATAFRAEWETPGVRVSPSPLHLGFLCEYDALPGIGHACGHNLIAEVGAAAALGLKGALEGLPGPPPPVKVRGVRAWNSHHLPQLAPTRDWTDLARIPCAPVPPARDRYKGGC